MALDPNRVKMIEIHLKDTVRKAVVSNLPEHWLRSKRASFRKVLAEGVDEVSRMFRLSKPGFRYRRYRTGSVWVEFRCVGLEIDVHVRG